MKALETVNKKETAPTYNRTKSVQDSVRYRQKIEPDFVGSGFHPPERFVPLLAKFSHPANATPQVQLFNQLQRHYGNRYVQRVVAAYNAQNAEEDEDKLALEIISKKGSGRALEPGNLTFQRLFKSGAIQAKLRISQPNDIYEQEADRVAEEVMRMPEPQVQWQPKEELKEKEKTLQTKLNKSQTSEVTPDLESRIQSLKGSGQPLPEANRNFMERRFGVDFNNVRIHTDSNAAQISRELNAEAFTHGRDIYFGAGIYSPSTSSGKRLLAHELTHVIQQDLNSSVTKIQRVVEGDITEMCITEDWARNLNDAELEEQINILGNHLLTLDPPTPEYDAARQNLRILEGAAARRLQPPYLVIAEREYRRGVVEDPECTNRGIDGVDNYTGVSGPLPVIPGDIRISGRCGRAWCAYFVKWCLDQAGVSNLLGPAAASVSRWTSCYYARDGVRFRNSRTSDVIDPLSGDIFFIAPGDTSPSGDPCYIPDHPCDTGACVSRGSGSGHCGFVRSVSGNTIRTIEGNVHISETNDGVDSKTRNISQLAGIVRIQP